jgi:predicted transcriptional regulator
MASDRITLIVAVLPQIDEEYFLVDRLKKAAEVVDEFIIEDEINRKDRERAQVAAVKEGIRERSNT